MTEYGQETSYPAKETLSRDLEDYLNAERKGLSDEEQEMTACCHHSQRLQ